MNCTDTLHLFVGTLVGRLSSPVDAISNAIWKPCSDMPLGYWTLPFNTLDRVYFSFCANCRAEAKLSRA